MTRCRRYLISGRVQGVFFRASTRDEAQRLRLSGRAINLDDGRVEVLACGNPDALQQLEDWLQHGPPQARVDHVAAESVNPRPLPRGFGTG